MSDHIRTYTTIFKCVYYSILYERDACKLVYRKTFVWSYSTICIFLYLPIYLSVSLSLSLLSRSLCLCTKIFSWRFTKLTFPTTWRERGLHDGRQCARNLFTKLDSTKFSSPNGRGRRVIRPDSRPFALDHQSPVKSALHRVRPLLPRFEPTISHTYSTRHRNKLRRRIKDERSIPRLSTRGSVPILFTHPFVFFNFFLFSFNFFIYGLLDRRTILKSITCTSPSHMYIIITDADIKFILYIKECVRQCIIENIFHRSCLLFVTVCFVLY